MLYRTIFASLLLTTASAQNAPIGYSDTPVLPGQKWRVHDIDRPRPPVVTPGAAAGRPPSAAIVLFDGKDLSKWVGNKAGQQVAPGWQGRDGAMEEDGGSGDRAALS